jgi:hypothetical protein
VVDEIEARIRAVVPTATRIFLEPDVVRAGSGPIDDPWSGLDREID